MNKEDPKIIYDTMRPVGDEFWNLINNNKTIQVIAEELCFQFDLLIKSEFFLKIAEGLYKADYIDLK